MKKILLIDIDSKIPNIALMKISGFYKSKGYGVTLYRLGGNAYHKMKRTCINARDFKMVFVSAIFTSNKDSVIIDGCDKVYCGGTGYDLKVKLPKYIDDFEEDYSIYPENDNSYGFITRGCIRHCYFCVVPEKEGTIYKYRNIDQIVRHKKVIFLDNNVLAHNDCKNILKELIDKNIRCQFNQGLDIRLVDDEIAELLSRLRYIGEYTFAFDDIGLMDLIKTKFSILKRHIKQDWKIRFFLYCHIDMPIIDIITRILWCKNNKCLPFLMRDKSVYNNRFYIELGSWCNMPAFFKTHSFKEFLLKRTIKESRKKEYIEAYLQTFNKEGR